MTVAEAFRVLRQMILALMRRVSVLESGTTGGGSGITQLTGEVTAGPGSGSQSATLSNTGVSAGTYGDATHVGQFTVDAKGRLTAASEIPITGGGVGSPAGFVSITGFYLDDGAALYGPVFEFTPPVDGDFAWINQGGASTAMSGGAVHLIAPQNVSLNLRIRKKAAPTAPYVITAAFLLSGADVVAGGLGFRQSSDGKLHLLQVTDPSTVVSTKYNSATSFSANYLSKTMGVYSVIWLRIEDDNTNRRSWISRDGLNWQLFHSVGRTDFLTADEVGFWANASATTDAGLTLLSWKET